MAVLVAVHWAGAILAIAEDKLLENVEILGGNGTTSKSRQLPPQFRRPSMEPIKLIIHDKSPLYNQRPDPRARDAREGAGPFLENKWVLTVPAAYINSFNTHEGRLTYVAFLAWASDLRPVRGPEAEKPGQTENERKARGDYQVHFEIGANFAFAAASEYQFELKFSARYQHFEVVCSSTEIAELDLQRMTFGRRGFDGCAKPVNELENTFKKLGSDKRTLFVITCRPEPKLSASGENNWSWLRTDPVTAYRNGTPLCHMLAAIGNWAYSALLRNNRSEDWHPIHENITAFLRGATVSQNSDNQ